MRIKLNAALETEVVNSRLNMLKIQNHWRKIIRSSKLDSLKSELEIIAQVVVFFRCAKFVVFDVLSIRDKLFSDLSKIYVSEPRLRR
jgi:hypothetical protein